MSVDPTKDRLASAWFVYFVGFLVTSCLGWGVLVDNPTPVGVVVGCHLVAVSLVSLLFCVGAGYALWKHIE